LSLVVRWGPGSLPPTLEFDVCAFLPNDILHIAGRVRDPDGYKVALYGTFDGKYSVLVKLVDDLEPTGSFDRNIRLDNWVLHPGTHSLEIFAINEEGSFGNPKVPEPLYLDHTVGVPPTPPPDYVPYYLAIAVVGLLIVFSVCGRIIFGCANFGGSRETSQSSTTDDPADGKRLDDL
jgi:hypothetical protein